MEISIRQIYPYWGVMLAGFFLCASQSFSKDLTLEEVVEALNFSRRVIEDGELQVIYFRAAEPKVSSGDETRSLEVDVAQWKEKYRTVKHQKEKKGIQQELGASEGKLEYLTKGRGTYEERNIVFQVKKHSRIPNLSEDLYFRIHRIDRHDEYEGNLGAYNAYTRGLNLPVQYHNTVILDGEHTIYLWADGTRTNAGFVEPLRLALVRIPYQLWGRSPLDITVERVRDFQKETHDTFAGYTVEFETEHDLGKIHSITGLLLDSVTQKLWVDPQQGFSVIRLDVQFHAKGVHTTVEVYRYGSFQKLRGGIWYPSIFEVTTYSPLDPAIIISNVSYEIKEADFNIGIPEGFFDGLVENGRQMGLLRYPQNSSTNTQGDR